MAQSRRKSWETKVYGSIKEKEEAEVKEHKDAIFGGSFQAIKDAMADLKPRPAQQLLGP